MHAREPAHGSCLRRLGKPLATQNQTTSGRDKEAGAPPRHISRGCGRVARPGWERSADSRPRRDGGGRLFARTRYPLAATQSSSFCRASRCSAALVSKSFGPVPRVVADVADPSLSPTSIHARTSAGVHRVRPGRAAARGCVDEVPVGSCRHGLRLARQPRGTADRGRRDLNDSSEVGGMWSGFGGTGSESGVGSARRFQGRETRPVTGRFERARP